MKITITKGENEEKIKEFEIPTEKIVRALRSLGYSALLVVRL